MQQIEAAERQINVPVPVPVPVLSLSGKIWLLMEDADCRMQATRRSRQEAFLFLANIKVADAEGGGGEEEEEKEE